MSIGTFIDDYNIISGANDGDIKIEFSYLHYPTEEFSNCPCKEILMDLPLTNMGLDEDFIFPHCAICDTERSLNTLNSTNKWNAFYEAEKEYIEKNGSIIYKWLDLPPKFSAQASLVATFQPIEQRQILNPEWVEKYGKKEEASNHEQSHRNK